MILSEDADPATTGVGDGELRQRGAHADGGEAATEPAARRPSKSNTALRWFGVLVPQPLRQAQNDFKQGVLVVFSVCSI